MNINIQQKPAAPHQSMGRQATAAIPAADAFAVSAGEAPQPLEPAEFAEFSKSAMRTFQISAVLTASVNALCLGIGGYQALGPLQAAFEKGAPTAAAVNNMNSALGLVAGTSTLVFLAGVVAPLVSRLVTYIGRQSAQIEAFRAELREVSASNSVVTRASEDLRRAVIARHQNDDRRAAEAGRAEAARRVNHDTDLRNDVFESSAPGPVSTLDPGMISEIRGGYLPGGGIKLEVRDRQRLANSILRLTRDSLCPEWTIILRTAPDRDSLLRMVRVAFGLDAFPRQARQLGVDLDLSKLKVRLLAEPTRNATTVVLMKHDDGDLEPHREVLHYDVNAASRMNRVGVITRGLAYRQALIEQDRALAASVPVSPGMVRRLLHVAAPDINGYVSEEAIGQWLATDFPFLDQILAEDARDRSVSHPGSFTF